MSLHIGYKCKCQQNVYGGDKVGHWGGVKLYHLA